jgi:hypothetical protein
MAIQHFVGPWPLFLSFIILYAVGRTPWTGDKPVARPLLHTEQHKQNKRTQGFMPRVGFEPTILVFERVKTVHAVGPWPLFLSFIILYGVGRTPGAGDKPVARPLLHTEQHKQNKRTQGFMPRVGFESMTAEFERAKTVHALDRATTVIG